MFRLIGRIFEKLIVNLLTISVILGALYFFVFRNIF